MIQKPVFRTVVRREGPCAHITVFGPIDERSDFSRASHELAQAWSAGAREASFDLSGVDQLNSIGVKKWISFLDNVQSQRFSLIFERISEMIVAQANVISSMLGPVGTPIRSFAAPYLCSQCDKEFSREIKQAELSVNDEGGFSSPKLACADCGGALTFDEYEDEYFFFLKHSQTARRG